MRTKIEQGNSLSLRNSAKRKTHKGSNAKEMKMATLDNGPTPATLISVRKVGSEVVTESMRNLKLELKKELTQVRRHKFREDMKTQVDDLSTTINQQIKATTGQMR